METKNADYSLVFCGCIVGGYTTSNGILWILGILRYPRIQAHRRTRDGTWRCVWVPESSPKFYHKPNPQPHQSQTAPPGFLKAPQAQEEVDTHRFWLHALLKKGKKREKEKEKSVFLHMEDEEGIITEYQNKGCCRIPIPSACLGGIPSANRFSSNRKATMLTPLWIALL